MAGPTTRGDRQDSPDNRPSKRVRIAAIRDSPRSRSRSNSPSPTRNSGPTESTPRTRGPTACEKCRSRKTRCDNRRPCGYCTKHQIPCVYDDNDISTAPSVTGEQILEAITTLSDFVRAQPSRHIPCCEHLQQAEVFQRPNRPGFPRPEDWSSDGQHDYPVDSQDSAARPHGPLVALTPLRSQGMDSLLSWEPLVSYRPASRTLGDTRTSAPPGNQLPSIDLRELSRLEAKYIYGVHLKNPILDLTDLHNKILQVSENGLDWSTRTCLVTLVCAIGALTQRYQDPENISITTPSPGIVRSSIGYENEAELSMQFWGIAARRLGFAIGQNDVEAVQCLCLAGIWHMCRLDALQAWKYFNLAGAAWHAVNMTDELKFEIDVPGPILDNVDFPHAFPLPPNLSNQVLSPGHAETERGWYYYLAEIAARHMLNRLLRSYPWRSDFDTEKQIRQMVAQAEEMEEQVHLWYSSLPPMLSFTIPTGYVLEPHPDELAFILRHRYLGCRELIGRPFLRLCVEEPLQIDAQLRSRVASFASQCLQYCVMKVNKVPPQLHQGTWFLLRNVASSTLMLGAASMAQKCSWLLGAQEVVIPIHWQERIWESVEICGPYWDQNRGGASELRNIVHTVLGGCSEE